MPKTIVITGASDGIGAAAARQLMANGHHVAIVGRSVAKTTALARELETDHFVTDFGNLDQVRALAAELDGSYDRIDVLANNAGAVFDQRELTTDGFERTFQVNHLAPFLLTTLLLHKLLASQASVIQTSSMAARTFGRMDLDDLNNERNYAPMRAYGTTKLQNILFTRELHRRYHGQGLAAASFHPGVVATNFGEASTGALKRFYSNRLVRALMTTAVDGARQLVWLAESRPGTDWIPGTYYEKSRPARRSNPQAQDAELAHRLWEASEELLGEFLPAQGSAHVRSGV